MQATTRRWTALLLVAVLALLPLHGWQVSLVAGQPVAAGADVGSAAGVPPAGVDVAAPIVHDGCLHDPGCPHAPGARAGCDHCGACALALLPEPMPAAATVPGAPPAAASAGLERHPSFTLLRPPRA